jgi:hypothetical protein
MKQPWKFIWNFCDEFYALTGLRIQAPVEWVFPDFGPWLFGKMIGAKDFHKITDTKEIGK